MLILTFPLNTRHVFPLGLCDYKGSFRFLVLPPLPLPRVPSLLLS